MQNLHAFIFKIATCEAFFNEHHNFEFFSKNSKTMHHTKKSHASKHYIFTFYTAVPNFNSSGSINRSNKFDFYLYGQVNLICLKSNVVLNIIIVPEEIM